MGIAGSGKTTIGKLLAENLQWPFYDADNFHSAENIQKMKSHIPLTDADRIPWLETIRDEMETWEADGNAVVACSALKESYRKILQEKVLNIQWVFLKGSENIINDRILKRSGHFMKATLLKSQLQDLEEPSYALTVSVNDSPEHIVQKVRTELKI